MSVVSFNYWDIEDSIKKAKKTASYLSDYVSDMNSIVRSCNSLPGSDSYGYVDQAVELVKKKVSHANKVKNDYTAYASELDALERKAEAADLAVEKNINVTVSDYVGRRSWGQAIGDFIYNRYVDFLDCVSNLPLVGDYLAQGIRMAGNWVLDMTGQAYNWFKYGDGKYVWNIVAAVTGVLVAAAGVVAAVVAIGAAAVPTLAVIAAVGAVAGMIALVLKFGDMMASIEQNTKALELSGEYRKSTKDKDEWWDTEDDQGSITAARYYGSVTGVKDWIDKTDFGGKTANGILGVTGSVYSWVEHAAETTSAVCTLIVGLGNAQYVKAPDGEWARYKPPKGVKSKTAKPDGAFFQNIKAANQEKALKAGNVIKKDGSFFQNVKTAYLEKAGVVYKRTPVFKKYSVRNGQLQIAKYDYSKVL